MRTRVMSSFHRSAMPAQTPATIRPSRGRTNSGGGGGPEGPDSPDWPDWPDWPGSPDWPGDPSVGGSIGASWAGSVGGVAASSVMSGPCALRGHPRIRSGTGSDPGPGSGEPPGPNRIRNRDIGVILEAV